jgi:hypothetical protein
MHNPAQYVSIVLMAVFEYESAWFDPSKSVEVGPRAGTGQAVRCGAAAGVPPPHADDRLMETVATEPGSGVRIDGPRGEG